MSNLMSVEDWYNMIEEELNIELAENGADREMDFDIENEIEIRYDKYVENWNNAKKGDVVYCLGNGAMIIK
jgi:putative transposon-encoded protein|tara:strand:- start:1453 stop:1665 length:213 start_codon:yes stop_codon:yes gene_type:complete